MIKQEASIVKHIGIYDVNCFAISLPKNIPQIAD